MSNSSIKLCVNKAVKSVWNLSGMESLQGRIVKFFSAPLNEVRGVLQYFGNWGVWMSTRFCGSLWSYEFRPVHRFDGLWSLYPFDMCTNMNTNERERALTFFVWMTLHFSRSWRCWRHWNFWKQLIIIN